MDTLILDEKKYISSRRAAKFSGYTKDYIGQLCRAGSLSAKMVGRSWYVEEESLKDHKKTYKGASVVDGSVWDVNQIEEDSRPLREVAAKYISDQEKARKTELLDKLFNFKYEKDKLPLMPQPVKKESKTEASIKENIQIIRKPTVSRLNTLSNQTEREIYRNPIQHKVSKNVYMGDRVIYRNTGQIMNSSGILVSAPQKAFNVESSNKKEAAPSYSVPRLRIAMFVGLLVLTPLFIGTLLLEQKEVYENTSNGDYIAVEDGLKMAGWALVVTKTRLLLSSVINLD